MATFAHIQSSVSQKALNQIYSALDNHYYTRAVKLCQQHLQQLPGSGGSGGGGSTAQNAQPLQQQAQQQAQHLTSHSNVLVVALLAHAYAKSGQRYKALLTIHQIFSNDAIIFPELQLELRCSALWEGSVPISFSQSIPVAMSTSPAYSTATTTAGSTLATTTTTMESKQSIEAASPPSKKTAFKRGGKKKSAGTSEPKPTEPTGTGTGKTTTSSSASMASTGTQTQHHHSQPQPQPQQSWDWIDQLDTTPTVPSDWDQWLTRSETSLPLSPTLLATLAMTMTVVLKLPLTAYQLYMWAINTTTLPVATTNQTLEEEKRVYIHQAYLHGLALLLAPQYATLHGTILTHLQGLAVQVARSATHLPPTALWPAQTALWQVAHTRETTRSSTNAVSALVDPQRSAMLLMLPKLAESLAFKCVTEFCRREGAGNDGTDNQNHSMTSGTEENSNGNAGGSIARTDFTLLANESFLLYMRTLEQQQKWVEQIQALNDYSRLLPKQAMADLKLQALSHLDGRDSERREILEDLLKLYPDDWDYWKQHWQASIAQTDGEVEEGSRLTEDLVTTILNEQAGADSSGKYPLRGPRLTQVELALGRMKVNQEAQSIHALVESIVLYGNEFCGRTSCIFSDVRVYLQECVQIGTIDHVNALLDWSKELRSAVPTSDNANIRRKQLRVYIFAVQVSYQVLVSSPERWDAELPPWEDLVRVWRDFQMFEMSENVDQVQKESRPADELILLAVERLLCKQPGINERIIAACLLETAIQNSPYNPYLKICAMFVYSDMNAAARSLELYSDLSVKHIQNETCSYLILPLLRSGGFYRETISVCQDVIVLQRAAGRDVAEYVSRAMENGAVSKAEEFIDFHRNRMIKSLTTLEAKGLILDAAPLLVHDSEAVLGVAHGIVGGDTDIDRVKQMVIEAHNPNGAFSLLQLSGPVEELSTQVSVNRDLSILSYEILVKREFDSPEQVIRESVRRGHQHNILIRAVLLVDASKGPKKGKATKTSTELQRRSKSLLVSLDNAGLTVEPTKLAREYGYLLKAVIDLCIAMVALSSGLNSNGDAVYETLDVREEAMFNSLEQARNSIQSAIDAVAESNDMTIPKASRLLPECIAPLFAIFQMSAKLADLYGWGRRKRKTKRCADAIANVATSFAQLIHIVKATVSSLPAKISYTDIGLNTEQSNLIDATLFDATNNAVVEAQDVTYGSMNSILDYVYGTLNGYNIDE